MTNIKPNYNQNQYPAEPEDSLDQNQDLHGTSKPNAHEATTNNYDYTASSYKPTSRADRQMTGENRYTGMLVGIGVASVAALVAGTMFLPGLLKQKEQQPAVTPSQTESSTTIDKSGVPETTEGINSDIKTLGGSQTLPVENETQLKVPVGTSSSPQQLNGYGTESSVPSQPESSSNNSNNSNNFDSSSEATSPENSAVDSPTNSAPTSGLENNSNNFQYSPGETTQQSPSVDESTTAPGLSEPKTESNNFDANQGGNTLEAPSTDNSTTISPESSQLESNPTNLDSAGGENIEEYPSTYDSTTSPEAAPLESNPDNGSVNVTPDNQSIDQGTSGETSFQQ